YLFFAIATLSSAEIRRSIARPQILARPAVRHFHPRLALLTVSVALAILGLTAGLFFFLPRTAEAALSRLIANRIYVPGFSNQVTLGQIGEIKTTSRPVMHVRIYSRELPGPLKWRGAALTHFDGRQWSNPPGPGERVPIEDGHADLTPPGLRIAGRRINYHVE